MNALSVDSCRQADCTFGVTGICLLGNPPGQCPHKSLGPQLVSEQVLDPEALAPALEIPAENPRFPPSTVWGLDEAASLMASRYCRVVGVLGSPDSGKTAFLTSLYSLLASGQLDSYEYADSRTLMAFEEICRGTRRWNEGQLPEQLTAHTNMADERIPGFLHLRLRSMVNSKAFDLLIPDLPGEWTESLIDFARSDRWEFLKGCDVLWITIDGTRLTDSGQMLAAHRLQRLLDRLITIIPSPLPPVQIVVTRRDKVDVPEETMQRLAQMVSNKGFKVQIFGVASFGGENALALGGTGVAEVIDFTVKVRASVIDAKHATSVTSNREMMKYVVHRKEAQ